MADTKRLLFLLVILLSFYLLYKLVERRQQIFADYEAENTAEPFVDVMSRISPCKNMNFPLKEYAIMSSWNSATDESLQVSLDALDKVLTRGYRFIDLEIYSLDNKPNVGFSTQKNYDTMESTPLLFLDVCQRIMLTGFSTNNGQDPLFLHLRIKSASPVIFEKLADICLHECKSRLYDGKVTKNTILSELQGKLVIIVDRNYYPQSETYKCIDSCVNDFTTIINMYSGTPELESMPFIQKLEQPTTPLMKTNDGLTNVEKISMVIHNMGSLNVENNGPEFYSLLKNYSIQIFPQKVYYRDQNLNLYEDFFLNNGHRAFVPMSIAFSFIHNETELD